MYDFSLIEEMKQLETNVIETVAETEDEDLCNKLELNKIFSTAESVTEYVVAKNKYILDLSTSSEVDPNIAIALSDYSCEVYSVSNREVAKVTTLKGHEDKLIGCKFSTDNSSLVYTGSSDGSIKLWDMRSPKKASMNFIDESMENTQKRKVFNCFDISPNNRLLTAGTDVIHGDSYLLFWDLKSGKLLGGYWESHTDDITEVKFHPNDSNKLISGSTDGLINLYNLSEQCEDDALLDSLNTESSVQQLSWYKSGHKDNIGCITHTNDLQLWYLDRAEPVGRFQRNDIATQIKRKCESFTYIASIEPTRTSPIILAGSNANEGECFRGLTILKNKLVPAFIFPNNKQRVRSSCYNENTNRMFTGGEKGILNIWKMDMKGIK